MARRKWRGYASFDMPLGQTEALMTVCPGNPEQEGARFESIMQAAGSKLEKLYIIEAAELGYHNLKRLLPKGEAREFAKFRGQKWQAEHQVFIDRYMPHRCEIIPMNEIVSGSDHEARTKIIKDIHYNGNNSVTEWFNYSANLDIETRSHRKEKEGIIIEPWAIRENSIDYLCEEYSMRSLMWQQFKLNEIYLGLAITDWKLIQGANSIAPEIDLTLPPVQLISLHEIKMVHDRKLGRAFPSNDSFSPPEYAGIPTRTDLKPAP